MDRETAWLSVYGALGFDAPAGPGAPPGFVTMHQARLIDAVIAVVSREREACAKIAESSPVEFIAREIRARSTPTK